MHPSLIISHPHQTTEYTYSIVYMYYVVSYSERGQVIDGQLLAFLYSPSYAHTVKTVKNLMVTITADLTFMIDETIMDIAAGYELRKYSTVLRQYRLESFKL